MPCYCFRSTDRSNQRLTPCQAWNRPGNAKYGQVLGSPSSGLEAGGIFRRFVSQDDDQGALTIKGW